MKAKKRIIISSITSNFKLFLSVGLMLSVLVGCNNESIKNGRYVSMNSALADSYVIASNSQHELYWDKDAKSVLLKSKHNGKIWSDILYDAYQEGSSSANGNSPIAITVINNISLKTDTVTSYSAFAEDGSVLCKKIDNGIRVTYFFNTYRIAIPVEYVLYEDSLKIAIDGTNILEDGSDYKLVSVSLTPKFCSVSNKTEGAYLFVPSGTGALMYSAEDSRGTRTYLSEVYGSDASRQVPKNYVDEEAVRLPVFGASDGKNAMLGIIEEGAGSAFIEAQAGNSKLGYSSVGAIFYFRGYDLFRYQSHGTGNVISTRVTDELFSQRVCVSYYPLYDEEANYNSMVIKYRDYLSENEELTKTDRNCSPYSITLNGGTIVKVSNFGISRKKLAAMTTFTEALDIVKDLYKNTDILPIVRMMNYGDNGMNPGTLGGGKKYPSVFGNDKQLSNLQNYVSKNNGLLFMDSDIIRYQKSGYGFSRNKDCSLTPINHPAEHYLTTPIRILDEDYEYRIISRKGLLSATEKIIDKAKSYDTNAVSLSTVGNIAFSDYGDVKYNLKNNIEGDISSIFNKLKKSGYVTATASANSYAACSADVLFDISTEDGNYDALDVQIPFYQMVFHSYKPLYSDSVNISDNPQKNIMYAVSSGMGIDFSLIKEYINELDELQFYKFYAMAYEDNVSTILKTVQNTDFVKCYNGVANSKFDKYEIFDNGLSKSYYSNGIVIYANHTSKSIDSPVGKLEAYGFGFTKGG